MGKRGEDRLVTDLVGEMTARVVGNLKDMSVLKSPDTRDKNVQRRSTL